MFFSFFFSFFQFCNGGDLADYLHCEYNLNFAIGVEFLCCQDLFEPLLSLSICLSLSVCVCVSLSLPLSLFPSSCFFFLGGGGGEFICCLFFALVENGKGNKSGLRYIVNSVFHPECSLLIIVVNLTWDVLRSNITPVFHVCAKGKLMGMVSHFSQPLMHECLTIYIQVYTHCSFPPTPTPYTHPATSHPPTPTQNIAPF